MTMSLVILAVMHFHLKNSETQLRDFLLIELKSDVAYPKKRPWMEWILVFLFSISGAFLLLLQWKTHTLLERVSKIDKESGIAVTSVNIQRLSRIQLSIMWDPATQPIVDWLKQQSINQESVSYSGQA
jgi:hypothetical protein